jgi:poly-gamma-glutamate system protein
MRSSNGRLLLAFVVAVAAWLMVGRYGQSRAPHPLRDKMAGAALRTERAFAVVDSAKRAGGHAFPADSPLPWAALLGEDYTAITTTLGSREAKGVSTNPAWASVMVRLLSDAGVAEGDTVAVLVSASFPALAAATLAALEELGSESLVLSSLGSSSYGANVRGATWLDWERWLRESGVLSVRSTMVTAGGERDAAGGLPAEGVAWLDEAAKRNGVEINRYQSLEGAISARMKLLDRRRPRAVVNIGGGHASTGGCRHAASLPVGLWVGGPECHCPDRGVLTRLYEQGVPVIHMLRLRGLASRYGLDFEPGGRYSNSAGVTTLTKLHKSWILAALSVIIVSTAILGKRLS